MAKTAELVQLGGVWKGQAQATVGSSLTSGIVAHAGGGQAAAIADAASQLPSSINIIATCATGADSVVLPANPEVGDELWIRNNGAASCNVFPQVGGAINNGSTNAALALANAKTVHYKAISSLNWLAVLTA